MRSHHFHPSHKDFRMSIFQQRFYDMSLGAYLNDWGKGERMKQRERDLNFEGTFFNCITSK